MLAHDRIMLRLDQEKDAANDRLNHLKLLLDMLMGAKHDMEVDLRG